MVDVMTTIYVLTLNIAGPGFVDRIEISSEDPLALMPSTETDASGIVWERYYGDNGEHDYAEVRQEYIVMRQMRTMEVNDPIEPSNDGPDFPFDPRRGGIVLDRERGGDS